MARNYNDFITAYLKYVKDTESPLAYKKWVAISTISASLQKKCRFNLGRIPIFPNVFVVLVGPPGARKSAAINFGRDLMSEVGEVTISADATSKEALIIDLEEAQRQVVLGEGQEPFTHSSVLVCSSEFESFLGSKQDNRKMTVFLIDLFDCPDRPWVYKTKNKGTNAIPSVYLNILAATTPDSIANTIAPGHSGSGFTARLLFIYADGRAKDVPFPVETPEILQMRTNLCQDLKEITSLIGEFRFTPEARAFWDETYSSFAGAGPNPICKHPSFAEWYDRKPLFVIKLSCIISASESNSMTVTLRHIHRALGFLEEVEEDMGNAFKTVGRSEVAVETELIFTLVKNHREITEGELRNIVWRDMDDRKFHNIIQTAVKTGKIIRTGYNPITYKWKGDG